MAAGVGLKTIAKRSGVPHGTLSKLIYGDGTRLMAPSKRIRKTTEDKLLAVSPADAADGAKIPAGETWRVIDELVRRGWTKTAIARAIGQQVGGLQLSRSQVTAGNARAVKALLDVAVPPRRSRWGIHEVPQADPDDDLRDAEGRRQEADRRQEYRTGAPVDRYQLPAFGTEGDTDWMVRGACRRPEVPTWLFYPGRGDTKTVAAAKAVCASCSVSTECLTYALAHGEPGIWGGTTGAERRTMRQESAVA